MPPRRVKSHPPKAGPMTRARLDSPCWMTEAPPRRHDGARPATSSARVGVTSPWPTVSTTSGRAATGQRVAVEVGPDRRLRVQAGDQGDGLAQPRDHPVDQLGLHQHDHQPDDGEHTAGPGQPERGAAVGVESKDGLEGAEGADAAHGGDAQGQEHPALEVFAATEGAARRLPIDAWPMGDGSRQTDQGDDGVGRGDAGGDQEREPGTAQRGQRRQRWSGHEPDSERGAEKPEQSWSFRRLGQVGHGGMGHPERAARSPVDDPGHEEQPDAAGQTGGQTGRSRPHQGHDQHRLPADPVGEAPPHRGQRELARRRTRRPATRWWLVTRRTVSRRAGANGRPCRSRPGRRRQCPDDPNRATRADGLPQQEEANRGTARSSGVEPVP